MKKILNQTWEKLKSGEMSLLCQEETEVEEPALTLEERVKSLELELEEIHEIQTGY